MIIQSLVDRYNNSNGKMPFGWGKDSAHYGICIDGGGNVTNIISLGTDDKGKTASIELTLPLKEKRTAGIKAYFLSDTSEYLLGVYSPKRIDKWREKNKKPSDYVLTEEDIKQVQEETDRKFEASKKLHQELLKDVPSDCAKAIKSFFDKPNPLESWLDSNSFPLNEKGEIFIFIFNNRRVDYVDCDGFIKQAYADSLVTPPKNRPNGGAEKLCLVTGVKDEIKKLHNPVSLKGVRTGRQPLISINDQKSFRSYGDTVKDPPCQIGKQAMFAYSSALNGLLKSGNNTISVGDDTLVYWVDNAEKEEEVFSMFAQPKEDDGQNLHGIMSAIKSAQPISGVKIDKMFYLLCLSPNASRISVRFFYKDAFGNILNNIANHYQNMEITGDNKDDKWHFIPYWHLLSETTVTKKAGDSQPLLGGQLLKSILSKARYPAAFFNNIIIRARADNDDKGKAINRTKAAAIKAVLIRNYNEKEVTTVALNKESNNIPYVLGRLFSILEQLQERASGGNLSSTIRDRYFNSACANPASAFPTLLKLSMHHSAKLGDDSRFLEIQKSELLGKLAEDKPFPQSLALDNQGRFILGYYHQTQDRYTKRSTENT